MPASPAQGMLRAIRASFPVQAWLFFADSPLWELSCFSRAGEVHGMAIASHVLVRGSVRPGGTGFDSMKIGELAKKAGCQVVTIRYYEKEGLLQCPERTEGNYRVYGTKDLEQLRFIRHCRLHGMTLAEIKELLAFKDHPTKNCDWINTLVEKHISNVDEQIASLQHLRSHLQALLHECAGGQGDHCGILRSLGEAKECPYCNQFQCQLLPHKKQ